MREPLRVFVATGTGLPFYRLLEALRPLAKEPNVELFVQRGAAGPSFVDLPGEELISREAFAERLAWADIVISHAGAGTIYEAYSMGHIPVLVPRLSRFGEHVNDHQLELATSFAEAERAIVCEDLNELTALVISARRRGERVVVEPRLVGCVREELFSSPERRIRVGFIATVRGLIRRGRARG